MASAFSHYFNPPTPCGVGPNRPVVQGAGVISIHPPRAGWDSAMSPSAGTIIYFNPPTPCGVGHIPRIVFSTLVLFQSTHPVRGGTLRLRWSKRVPFYFNPPTPCGVGPLRYSDQRVECCISIHPPRAGWDVVWYIIQTSSMNFNPPTPCGVGLIMPLGIVILDRISIHPPRAGWDRLAPLGSSGHAISIHPPRAGWDKYCRSLGSQFYHFNPPTPCGVGQFGHRYNPPPAPISIHPPRAGWDEQAPMASRSR